MRDCRVDVPRILTTLARVTATGVLVLAALATCTRALPPADASSLLSVVVALADGSLAAIDVRGTSTTPARTVLPSSQPAAGAQPLAVRNSTVFVLSADAVRAVSVANGDAKPLWSAALPPDSGRVGVITAGPRSGRVYIVGVHNGAPVSTTLDPTGKLIGTRELRTADGRDWSPYQVLTTADERALLVSYHGSDTTGVDVYPLTGDGPTCARARPTNASTCLPGHGHAEWFGGELLVATGMNEIQRIRADQSSGGTYDTTLAGNHLMEFTIDPSTQQLFAAGSCGYSGGLVIVELQTGDARRLASSGVGAGATCGEHVAVTPKAIILTRTANPVPDARLPGALLVLDRTGTRVDTVTLPSEPVHLAVVPP